MTQKLNKDTITKKKSKRKPVEMTLAVRSFIVDKVALGMLPHQIARNYPDKVPKAATIIDYMGENERFQKDMNKAYDSLAMVYLDEWERLSKSPASEIYPDKPFNEAEATLKRRMKYLETAINNIIPLLSQYFNKEKLKVKRAEAPTLPGISINVLSWNKQDENDRVISPAIHHLEDKTT